MDTLHPAIVHFAIVLPLMALTFQALFLLKKDNAYSKAALVTIVFAALFVLAAFLTGREDARGGLMELLSAYHEEGAHELKEHAELGIYLMYAIAVVALFKVVNVFKFRNKTFDIVILISFLIISLTMLIQGKEGGEIVYEHGTLFQAHEIKDTLKESLVDVQDADTIQEQVEIFTETIQSILEEKK